jgi:hypothetical protein
MRKEVITEVAVSSGGAPVSLGGAPMEHRWSFGEAPTSFRLGTLPKDSARPR